MRFRKKSGDVEAGGVRSARISPGRNLFTIWASSGIKWLLCGRELLITYPAIIIGKEGSTNKKVTHSRPGENESYIYKKGGNTAGPSHY